MVLRTTGENNSQKENIEAQVSRLNAICLAKWWSLPISFPENLPIYARSTQVMRERRLDGLIGQVLNIVQRPPVDPQGWKELEDQWKGSMRDFTRENLDFPEDTFDFLERDGFVRAALGFIQQARAFDPGLSMADLFQAGRNVWTMNFFQKIMGKPVELTPAIFAYSLLYPYTDNYLDNPAVSTEEKTLFSQRFARRLRHEDLQPQNQTEVWIWKLVGLIEGQYPRDAFPGVYDSLHAIHSAQAHSVELLARNPSPFETDILGISFEKGGTSVLADGYLVAGTLSSEEALFLYGYGAFTQLMDDQEDAVDDQAEGLNTIFSLTARHWVLDPLANRTYHYLAWVMGNFSAASHPGNEPLGTFIQRSIELLLADAVGRTSKFYSRDYLKRMETHLPFGYRSLDRQRSKIRRKQDLLSKFFEIYASRFQT